MLIVNTLLFAAVVVGVMDLWLAVACMVVVILATQEHSNAK